MKKIILIASVAISMNAYASKCSIPKGLEGGAILDANLRPIAEISDSDFYCY